MIGKHYSIKDYHCAHFLAEWYETRLGVTIPIVGEFEVSFMRWMRKHFTQIDNPVDNCLVYMYKNKTAHVGVYFDYGVYHNYKPARSAGAVVHWDLGVVKRNFEKVSYWQWSI